MAASLDVSSPAMGSLSIDDPSAKEDDNDRPVVDGETVGSWNPRQAYDYKSYTATRDPDAPRNEPYGEWAASGARYEWDNDYGDLAPRCEKLERMLFDLDDDEPCAGIDFRRYVYSLLDPLIHRLPSSPYPPPSFIAISKEHVY